MKMGTRGGTRELRIIGGAFRGRKLRFPEGVAIRPTPDRVRETLFNWLQPVIRGARCLDLFAGSGALGLEALSRGASRVMFVDASRAASLVVVGSRGRDAFSEMLLGSVSQHVLGHAQCPVAIVR